MIVNSDKGILEAFEWQDHGMSWSQPVWLCVCDFCGKESMVARNGRVWDGKKLSTDWNKAWSIGHKSSYEFKYNIPLIGLTHYTYLHSCDECRNCNQHNTKPVRSNYCYVCPCKVTKPEDKKRIIRNAKNRIAKRQEKMDMDKKILELLGA